MAIHSVSISEIIKCSQGKLCLKAEVRGEDYERMKHGSKTEIKAVTFSNMRIDQHQDEKVDIYVIFDI